MKDQKNMKRTVYCGEVTESHLEKEITVCGWVARKRNLGSLIFVDLRDRTGIVQVVLGEDASNLKNEYVVAVKGVLKVRQSINDKIKTGRYELIASSYEIISEAEITPFFLADSENVNDALKLKYRYLDLRTPALTEKLVMRSRISKIVRDYLDKNSFLEIETPLLGRSTPEGARDYLVPSRVHDGKFYALPQSPQLYKQLLMISGLDRYYQIAKCFRDEDLRANRQPEFTQIDIEMSFAYTEEDVMEIAEGMIKDVFRKTRGVDLGDIERVTYQEVINDYGSDKPDRRFGMKIKNVTDILKNTEFAAFSENMGDGKSIRLINAEGLADMISRKECDALSEFVKAYGAKGVFFGSLKADGFQSSIKKFLSEEQINTLIKTAAINKGDIIFIIAGKDKMVLTALGALRCEIARKFGLIKENIFSSLWVTDFPLFEYSEEDNRLYAQHHPFTAPKDEDIALIETNPTAVRSKAYDLVINGEEMGGGSIRMHSRELQSRVFRALGFSDEDIMNRFGFFVEAFSYGAPPHGGVAFGLDRLVMSITNTNNIKDVIAFPKVQNASDLMTEAPNFVEESQLRDLHLLYKNEQRK